MSGSLRQLPALTAVVVALAAAAVASRPTFAQAPGADAATGGSARETSVAFGGSHRTRWAHLDNQFRPGLTGDDRVLSLRTTFRVEAALPRATLVGELQDARAYLTDEQSAVSTIVVNAFDVSQAYARFGPRRTDASAWGLRAGRFLMELGAGRLVAAETYRDVARTFTGVVTERPLAAGALTGFAVLPVDVRPAAREALLDNEIRADAENSHVRFWGAYYARPLPPPGAAVDAYALRLQEHDGPPDVQTRNRNLTTVGLRVHRDAASGAWDFDVESAWQRGETHATAAAADQRELDVRARLLHAHAGYTLRRPWSPRISVEYDYGSGDSDPADGEWGRFDALYGNRRMDLGPTGIYGALGRENIEALGVRLTLTPNARTDAFIAYRTARLAAAADAFVSTGVRDPTGASSRDGGRHLDARFRRWLIPRALRLDSGVTYLDAGRFLRNAPNATRGGDTTYVYADVTYTFTAR